MINKDLMMQNGQAFIDFAKVTGTWEALADAQNLVISNDLRVLFDKRWGALFFWRLEFV